MADELTAQVKQRAYELGFARVGIARALALGIEAERLRGWIDHGRHGQMLYMAETAEVRADPRHEGMMPSARSVIVLVTPYGRRSDPLGPAPGRIAAYARGRDYHNIIGKRTRKLARFLRTAGHRARPSVDLQPVYERAWAQRSGVGFIGKNCCLIAPGLGSHVLLATVLTSAELAVDSPMPERCGACHACLDACPTSAFVDTRQLDARLCISYLTIEQPGPIPEPLRHKIGDRLFGCDDCQDVCPYNRIEPPDIRSTQPFATDRRWVEHDAASLLRMSPVDLEQLACATPLRRAARVGLARSAAVVLGNMGRREHLPVLREVASTDSSAIVREAAEWAVERIETS